MKVKRESEEPVTTKLIQLQEDMQKLLITQMKQEDAKRKKEAEHVSTAKLPKIEILSFNGDTTRWV